MSSFDDTEVSKRSSVHIHHRFLEKRHFHLILSFPMLVPHRASVEPSFEGRSKFVPNISSSASGSLPYWCKYTISTAIETSNVLRRSHTRQSFSRSSLEIMVPRVIHYRQLLLAMQRDTRLQTSGFGSHDIQSSITNTRATWQCWRFGTTSKASKNASIDL